MTESAVPTAPRVPFGQALGEASRHASALHLRVLDSQDSSFLEWVVLTTIATADDPVVADDLSAHLSEELSIDVAEVEDVFSTLRSSGRIDIIAVDGTSCLAFSNEGRAYHARVREAVGRVSAELLEGFDPAEVATTIRVLTTVRERAPLIAIGG